MWDFGLCRLSDGFGDSSVEGDSSEDVPRDGDPRVRWRCDGVRAMARKLTPAQRRTSQIAQAYRNAHEIVSACLGLAALAGGGYWLDHRLGWSPVLTICGACLGFVTAGFSLNRLLRRLDREARRAKERSSERREAEEQWPEHRRERS